MNPLICSVRVRSCDRISGTVSGIGSGISPGSGPTEVTAPPDSPPGVITGVVVAGDVDGMGVTSVPAGTGAGSFENLSNVKSKTLWRPVGENVTFACIDAGS